MHPPGGRTNMVTTRRGTSRRERGRILVSPESLVSACRKALLLALRTHLIMAFEFTIRSNPAGRLFRFRMADSGSLQWSGLAALVGVVCALEPDDTFTLYWACLQEVIPPSCAGFCFVRGAASKLFALSS